MSNEQHVKCEHCGARTYPVTETRTHFIRRCLSSSKHITYIEKSQGQRIRVQGQPPDAA